MPNYKKYKPAGNILVAILFFTSNAFLHANATGINGTAGKDFSYTNLRLNSETTGSEADVAALTSLLGTDANAAATAQERGNALLLQAYKERFPALFQKREWPTRESLKASLQGLASGVKPPLAGMQAAGALALAGAYAGSQAAASMPYQGNTAQLNTEASYKQTPAAVPPLVVPPLITQQQEQVLPPLTAFAEPPQGPATLTVPSSLADDYTEEEIAAANARHDAGLAGDAGGSTEMSDSSQVDKSNLAPMAEVVAEEAPKVEVEEEPPSPPPKSSALLRKRGSHAVLLTVGALVWQFVM